MFSRRCHVRSGRLRICHASVTVFGCTASASDGSIATDDPRLFGLRPSSIGIVAEDSALHRCLTSIPASTTGTTDREPSEGSIVPERLRGIDRSEHEGAEYPVSPASRPRLDHRIAFRPRTREHSASLFWIYLKPERDDTSSNSWRGSARPVLGPRPDARFRIDMMRASMIAKSRSRCRPEPEPHESEPHESERGQTLG
jgi:hypothetical protein